MNKLMSMIPPSIAQRRSKENKFQFALRTVNIIQLAKVHPKQIFLQVIAHDLVNKEN